MFSKNIAHNYSYQLDKFHKQIIHDSKDTCKKYTQNHGLILIMMSQVLKFTEWFTVWKIQYFKNGIQFFQEIKTSEIVSEVTFT